MPLKDRLYHLTDHLGITKYVSESKWRRDRLLILCYHGISLKDEHEWDPLLFMSEEVFRRRMQLLHDRRASVLPLPEALERLYAGTLPPQSVVITFDDGNVDFAERALPVLRNFGFPATVYLTTYYSDSALPVFDTALAYLLWQGRDREANLQHLLQAAFPIPIRSRADRDAAVSYIKALAAHTELTARAKDDLLREIAQTIGADYGELLERRMLRIMSADDVRALPAQLINIQLHTHRHRTPRERTAFVAEVYENRRCLERMMGTQREYRHFCYPSGDYDRDFLPWLRDIGVVSATTCVPGIADTKSHPLLLPRFVDTMAQPEQTFNAWVSGLAALLPQSRHFRQHRLRIRQATSIPECSIE